MSSKLAVRAATKADVPVILGYIHKIAEYERLSHQVVATEEILSDELFGARPVAEALIGYVDQQPAGFAVYFHNFSTFWGRRGMYLEDLFVDMEHRGKGLGKALLAKVAAIAVERGCPRMEWAVLDWNQPSIDFYKALGAVPMDEWTTFRLTGDAMAGVASIADGNG